jgi:hypothetical protein
MDNINFDLNTFSGGALRDKFNKAMAEVIENLVDPNTPFKDKRAITLTITFEQTEERDDAVIIVSSKTKLANELPVKTGLFMEKDLSTGEIFFEEHFSKKAIKGQSKLDDFVKSEEIDEQQFDTETGEILDFRSRRAAND